MSALSCTYIDPWETLSVEGDKWSLLKDLSVHFIQTFLTLWAKGIMPECHGQNTMVCYENNKLKCFILRDHDTLRICTTAIKENGFTPQFIPSIPARRTILSLLKMKTYLITSLP